jgi:CRP-like cAMP-binding protein
MKSHDLSILLAQHALFRGLSDDDLAFIAGCAKNARYQEGEMLFRAGEPANEFFVLRHGQVALELHPPGRDVFRFGTLGEGDVAGWSWLIPPHRFRYDARALAATRVLAFDGACLRAKCEADPRLGYELMKRLAQVVIQRFQDTQLQLLDVYGRSG